MEAPDLTDFETKNEPVLPRLRFLQRWLINIGVAAAFAAVSLFAGMAGYHFTEHLPWLDAFTNASMILSGMGPLAAPQTPAGKLFAGCYALYSGLAFIVAAGVVLSPVAHRVLHKFHAESDTGDA